MKMMKPIKKSEHTTVPHQDDGYARIPAHTDLKQGAVMPQGPLDEASTYFYSLTGRVYAPTQPGSSYRRWTFTPLPPIRIWE